MRLGVGFWNVFGGFWEAKWSQVGTKNAPKIDLNFGRPILQKYLQTYGIFNDLLGFGDRSWDQNSIKNRSKNASETGSALSIDF